MERETEIRETLAAALRSIDQNRAALDLVEEIPLLEHFVEDLADARIAQARAEGASWANIADRLGVTRQAVHKRFSLGKNKHQGAHLELRLERPRRRRKSTDTD